MQQKPTEKIYATFCVDCNKWVVVGNGHDSFHNTHGQMLISKVTLEKGDRP